eukprot:5489465-Amphidinium_carterae.1
MPVTLATWPVPEATGSTGDASVAFAIKHIWYATTTANLLISELVPTASYVDNDYAIRRRVQKERR